MDTLIQVVEQYLNDDGGWSFERLSDRTVIQSGIKGKNSAYRMYFQTNEDMEILVVYTMMPQNIPEEHRVKVAEYITRANYGLRIGNFEMDMNDGEVRYKVSVDMEGGKLVHSMINNMVGASVSTMDRYFPGFMAICYAGKNAEEAIRDIEGSE